MPRDIKLTVAAATVGPQVGAQVLKPGFALEAVVPKLEMKADTTTHVVAVVTGEAL